MENPPVIIEGGAAQESQPVNPKAAGMVIVALTIVILLVMVWLYEKGKSSANPQFAKLPYDTTPAQSQNNQTPGATLTQNEITSLAQQIHSDITAGFMTPTNVQAWQTASNLSNTDSGALYDSYNALFYPNGGGDLIQDINSKSGFWESNDFNTLAVNFANRLQQLTKETSPTA